MPNLSQKVLKKLNTPEKKLQPSTTKEGNQN